MAGNKGKGGKSGSSNDNRGTIAKAQDAARKGGQDTASARTGAKSEKGGAGHSGAKSGGKG